jgi:CRISPR-associated endonuclease/helicase Cas3
LTAYKNYSEFFKSITEFSPYPFQIRYSEDDYTILNAFTGSGKTETVLLDWLWKIYSHKENTQKRLVYCLPMRTLVEQTYKRAKKYINKFNEISKFTIKIYLLEGGEDNASWDIYPEDFIVLVGTQDMLLSRALNRGYGTNKFRWPMDFGLLNNDSFWVFDEIQLMGDALKTSTQLQGFRNIIGVFGSTKSLWMSASLSPGSISSVDFKYEHKILEISKTDLADQTLNKIYRANKHIQFPDVNEVCIEDMNKLSKFVLENYKGDSIVILNTVSKAINLYRSLIKLKKQTGNQVEIILLHSHFRRPDRDVLFEKILEKSNNRIIISTQVIEAGVDISSNSIFTEIAPISSIIQRSGRCNRYGECEESTIYVINTSDMVHYKPEPYEKDEIINSYKILKDIDPSDVINEEFSSIKELDYIKTNFVIRKKDLLDLYNTDPGLLGDDIDISRFVRSGTDINAYLFWRNFEDPNVEDLPQRDELCPVPVLELEIAKKNKDIYTYSWVTGKWVLVKTDRIIPGNFYMIHSSSGFYNEDIGWDMESKKVVMPLTKIKSNSKINRISYDDNNSSVNQWKSIKEHSFEVYQKVKKITSNIQYIQNYQGEIEEAAKWHDVGKAHEVFQKIINQNNAPSCIKNHIAKAPNNEWTGKYERKYFRHELVSGLAALENGKNDLVAYLVVAHHGKIRNSIRAMPDENVPPDSNKKFARGVWDGDKIKSFEFFNGEIMNDTSLKLSYMELGETEAGDSWDYRILKLSSKIGIFKLGLMENILRSADQRASGGLL